MMKEISLERFYRIYYVLIFLFIIKQGFDRLFLHQFAEPILIFPNIDNTYWLFHLLNIPQIIASNYNSLMAFDIILLSCSIALIFISNQRWLNRLFFVLYFIYFICVNTFSGHHSHMLIGILFGNFIFCFDKIELQIKYIYLLRYYLLFIMTSAAIWKIARGSFFDSHHLSNIIYNQNLYFSNIYPKQILTFLIHQESISHILYITATLLELAFVIGFFTRKFDKLLVLLFILFFVMDYYLMGLNFTEMGILLITLFPIKKL